MVVLDFILCQKTDLQDWILWESSAGLKKGTMGWVWADEEAKKDGLQGLGEVWIGQWCSSGAVLYIYIYKFLYVYNMFIFHFTCTNCGKGCNYRMFSGLQFFTYTSIHL